MNNIVEVTGLNKKFGRKSVLEDTSFTIAPNKIVGLMGPNGSGKTTVLKILAGLSKKNSGEVMINGLPVGVDTKNLISFMPDENILYSWFRVKDGIKFYQDFFPDFDIAKCNDMLNFMDLKPTDKIKRLSKGMKERVLLTLTLSRKTKLYILDEPLGGVDPVAKSKIIDSILDHALEEGSSLILSTHLIKDVEKLFSDILFLKNGKIALSGDCEELRSEKNKNIEELYLEVFGNA